MQNFCNPASSGFQMLIFTFVFPFKIKRTVNQGCYLEFMAVSILTFGECSCEMNMFSISNLDGRRGFAAEFMIMTIRKICAEFYFMHMAASFLNCFAGYGTETMVMAIPAIAYCTGAAGDFMHMLLVSIITWI